MEDKLYVTYGFGKAKDFDVNKIQIDLTNHIGKPGNAWWGSPVSAEYGWKDWCEENDFIPSGKANDFDTYFDEQNAMYWKLETGSRILTINSIDDLEAYVEYGYIEYIDNNYGGIYQWNFYKVEQAGYDAIELTDASIGHGWRSNIEMIMNSWDCESICVINPSKIIVQRC